MSFQRFEVISQTCNALLEQMKQEESALLTISLAELKGAQAKKDAQNRRPLKNGPKRKATTTNLLILPCHIHRRRTVRLRMTTPSTIPGGIIFQ